ncbi:VIT1/CCC1 transporter family protein [Sphingomonas crusticola]|uniref:VIT1/CCC1 transporter family protein n=1 Tax=Sphingomonas crusticola TaxID=1697973 RepID=UPI000E27B00E|nr:VIT1/CCC1 transporter family protein [Sphingomonas crusticola]
MPHRHYETHAINHLGWLRAAVLGANDGILSTASLIVGVASASSEPRAMLIAGGAGLVAGALSMAAGEYVSVSSQADLERADLHREARELHDDPVGEHRELTGIYVKRGLERELAGEVASQLMAHDALGAHARDELGLSKATAARPIEAALASGAAFAVGAAIPLAAAALAPFAQASPAVVLVSLAMLAILGAFGARTGGAPVARAVARAVILGAAAMLLTIGLGRMLGTSI